MSKKSITVSSNTLILNESHNVDQLIRNLLDADIDELIFLDGGSTDGTWEKLRDWAKQEKRIIPIQWPQKAGTEYKCGFNEVARRNLMLDASLSDQIVYIDADERISTKFKASLDPAVDCTLTLRIHFWDGKIRMHAAGDRVWSPERQIRIFKRNVGLRFSSSDQNGLHNYLSRWGFKVPLGYAHGPAFVLLSIFIRKALGIQLGGLNNPPHLYHYHYYDLTMKKTNDLRSSEFSWPIEIDIPYHERKKKGVVYITETTEDVEAQLITSKYYK